MGSLAAGPATVAQSLPDAPSGPAKDARADVSQEAVVVESLRREFRFENDGSGVSSITARVKVQTQAGVQQLGQIVWGYNSMNEKLEVDYVRVRKPDGTVVHTPPEGFQDVPSPQLEREAPSYTDYRERHISVAALRPGDTLEYSIRTVTTTPLVPGQFWLEHVFRKDIITRDEVVEVNIPKGRTVTLKTRPDFEPKSKVDQGDRTVYTWTSNYLRRETEEELKKRQRKEAQEDWRPDVQMTTFRDWGEVGAWYAGLEKTQITVTAELRAKAEELIRGALTDQEKITRLYDYAAQDFRYVSLSFGLGRYQPHAAAEVLHNKYGDCKDKHTLFTALMRAAGFKVYPVLIGSRRKLDVDVPSPAQFDHVISAIMKDGSPDPVLWADTTTEIAPFGMLTYNIRKKKALLVGLEGGSRVIETPADPPFPSFQEFSLEGTLSELGKMKATVKGTYRGDQEFALRSVFRSVAEAKWKDVAKYISYQAGIGGEVENVKVKNLTDTSQPFYVEFEVSKPNFLDWASKSSDLNLPLPGITLSPASRFAGDDDTPDPSEPIADDDTADAAVTKEATRKDEKPIELGSPFDLKLSLKLTLPPGFKARTPVSISKRSDYGEYSSRYKVDGGTLLVERHYAQKLREIPAERRSDYQAFVRTVRADEKQKFHVETAVAATGAPELPKDIKADELIDSAREAFQSQNFRVALDLLKRAAEKEPKHKLVWNLLGEAYMGVRQFEDAEKSFRKQIELDKFDPYAYSALGRALWQQRRLEDAAKAFQSSLENNPLDKDALAALAEVDLELHRYEEAAEAMEKCVALEPDNAFYHANLGRAYLKLKREKDASDAFDKAVELQQNPMLWNNIAYELADNDSSLDRAQQYAESALSQVTSALRNVSVERLNLRDIANVSALGSYWDTLGWVYFKKGDLDKAEKYIAASWKLSQGGEVGDHLAQIYQKRGRPEDAVRLFAEAINGNRPRIDTRDRLAALVKDNAKVDRLIAEHKSRLEANRTYTLGDVFPGDARADFFVVLVPGHVEAVKFISGSEGLRAFASRLKEIDYGLSFPDPTPTKVVRRGTLTCEKNNCAFVLIDPEAVTSVN
jgi:Flp pilus assembly protein TadD/transglutaminase-like putative cysteine protease